MGNSPVATRWWCAGPTPMRSAAASLPMTPRTPLAVFAQQPAVPVVGILSGTNREPRLVGAIQQGHAEVGYAEGRNVALEYRFAEGRFERLPELAADLVRRGASVIVAMQSAA